MKRTPSASWSNVVLIAPPASPSASLGLRAADARVVAGQRPAQQRAEEVARRNQDEQDLLVRDLDDERPEQREAQEERRLEGDDVQRVGRQQLLARHDDGDHRDLGRAEERASASR